MVSKIERRRALTIEELKNEKLGLQVDIAQIDYLLCEKEKKKMEEEKRRKKEEMYHI